MPISAQPVKTGPVMIHNTYTCSSKKCSSDLRFVEKIPGIDQEKNCKIFPFENWKIIKIISRSRVHTFLFYQINYWLFMNEIIVLTFLKMRWAKRSYKTYFLSTFCRIFPEDLWYVHLRYVHLRYVHLRYVHLRYVHLRYVHFCIRGIQYLCSFLTNTILNFCKEWWLVRRKSQAYQQPSMETQFQWLTIYDLVRHYLLNIGMTLLFCLF